MDATPKPAVTALIVVAVLAFAVSMVVPLLVTDDLGLYALPLAMVAALWMVPLALALVRGERWAFIVALAVLIFVTDTSFRARDWHDKSLDWQAVMKGLVWLGAGLIGLARLDRTWKLFGTAPVAFALAFVAMLGASALWSPNPGYTVLSAMAYLWLFLFGLAAAEVLDEEALLKALALGCGLVVLPSLAIAPFASGITETSPGSTGEAHRLRGITDHPIPLAEEASLFTFACVMLYGRARGFARLALALLVVAGVATVLLTRSRIPPLAMVAAALGVAAYRRGGGPLMVATVAGTILAGAAMEALSGFWNLLPRDLLALFSRSDQPEEILTLSGRLLIWPFAIDRILEAPLLGHGHASGMTVFEDFRNWHITHAHNAYLQILLYVGLAGGTLAAGALLAQARAMMIDPRLVRDALFLYTLLKGMTEQSIISNMPSGAVVLWMVTIGMAALPVRRARREAVRLSGQPSR